MKIFATVATMIGLAAGSSVMAQSQPKVQDRFHTASVQFCVQQLEIIDQFLTEETDQKPLFQSLGTVVLIDFERNEVEQPVVITVYADQISGEFTILKTFVDGVTCVVTEGIEFEPYVD